MRVARLRRELTARWRSSPRLQDRVTAAWTFVVGAALDLIGFSGWIPWPWLSGRPTPAWAYLVPLAVGCLGLLAKRRHPVAVLGVCVLAVLADIGLGGSLAIVLVLFDAMFAVGLYGSARARTGLMTAVFVVIGTATVLTALATRNLQATVGVGLQLVALLVLPLWRSANVRVQRELGELTAEQARREAVYAERTAMARELHDAVASHLSTTAIHSAAALAHPPDPERDRAALRAVRESSLAALQEMRAMITVLRGGGDDTVVPAGLAQLPQAVEAARAGGLDISAEVTPVGLPAVVDQAAYRIVTEALTNARKHAPGARVRVDVRPVGDQLALTVTNTLTGAPTDVDDRGVSAGTGLAGMRERASMVGGTLTAGRDGDVWRVSALLPLAGVGEPGRVGEP
ncbi:MAG: two-component sensor histidine kinase, partial [Micromonosporaceae bacterium]|nr:two-component sensor histidine kinase [Micromonosporaceae bacterium]